MEERSLAYARYWRNSLADAELGKGGLKLDDADRLDRLSNSNLPLGQIDPKIVAAYFDGEKSHTQTVEVVIRPRVYLARFEHGKLARDGRPEVVTPLVTPALLDREGRLFPTIRSVVPRDLLEPLERGAFAIGAVADLDTFLTRSKMTGVAYPPSAKEPDDFTAQWQAYLSACQELLGAVCPGWLGDEGPTGFEFADYGYLSKTPTMSGASQHILRLYDHLQQTAPAAPLFDRFASEAWLPPESCLDAQAAFADRLGHSNDLHPLATAQRDALNHVLASRGGDVLAVNGPPGTGKTTLLLSVVATLWARAALDGGEPPVIVAASTNNQAVTNIIDAFGKDFAAGSGPFAGRWLPDIDSFGAYFPNAAKEKDPAGKYQTRKFFDALESQDYVDRASLQFIERAGRAFTGLAQPTLQAVVDALQQGIRSMAGELAAIDAHWKALATAREQVRAELGDDPASEQAERERMFMSVDTEAADWDRLAQRFAGHLANESLIYSLFAWLPPVGKKRLRLARFFVEQAGPPTLPLDAYRTVEQIEAAMAVERRRTALALDEQQRRVQRGRAVLDERQRRLAEWARTLAPLGAAGEAGCLDLAAADALADNRLRFPIFLWTTHYWEGRWLLDMQANLPEIESSKSKTGRKTMTLRWRRRMMLTPCIVSTFYMLPKEMKLSRREGQGFVDDYLTDFADLLIVDEAGQVLPEIAAPSFALAKKALVIGDSLQIEPIWSVPVPVDIGNLVQSGLLEANPDEADFERLADLGKTASSGSVMRIAQCASRWHYDPDFARGFFLYEHRRCFDEIIAYCNRLCYRGKLIPMRGPKPADESPSALPAMAHLHIDGLCRRNGGSRENLLEAETIAAWLSAKKPELEATYGKKLHQIVGVVTPFGGQVRAITRACHEAGLAVGDGDGEMTVGTVHSLQGAERLVVIFSSVYSKHAGGDGEFIDRSPSLLNVAVSRAKDSFLLFGDMDVFELAAKNKPRGQLASLLLGPQSRALEFERLLRRDLTKPRFLHQSREHDDFLAELLSRALREVHIVTPWIRLECVHETGAMESMVGAIRRGVKVTVYLDRWSNASVGGYSAWDRKMAEFEVALQALRSNQIDAVVVRKVHSKILIGDEDVYCIGSFNWFSAKRESFERIETSLVYRGPDVASEIDSMKASLAQRAERPVR